MNNYLFKFVMLFLIGISTNHIFAQSLSNTALGQWQSYQCYKAAKSITQADNLIYIGTDAALFSYDIVSKELRTYTKIDGFSDVNIKNIVYDPLTQQLVVLYANNNIDLYKNGKVTNFKDILNANIGTSIVINSSILDNGILYYATNVGIIAFDLQAIEIKDTYFVGNNAELINVYQVAISQNYITAATEDGLLKANKTDNLWDYHNWHRDTLIASTQNVWHAAYFNDILYAEIADNQLYKQENDGTWTYVLGNGIDQIRNIRVSNNHLLVVQQLEKISRLIDIGANQNILLLPFDNMPRAIDAITNGQNTYWVADEWIGLHEWNADNSYQNIYPNSPRSSNGIRLYHRDNELWVAPGNLDHKFDGTSDGLGENFEGIWRLKDDEWAVWNWNDENTKPYKPNIVTIAFNNNNKDIVYWGAVDGKGLFEFNYAQNTIDDLMPNLRPLQNFTEEDNVRIAAVHTDKDNNLWMTGLLAPNPIMVKKNDGTYKSFRFNNISSGEYYRFTEIETDDNGNIWTLINAQGVLVMNPDNVINSNSPINTVSSADYQFFKPGEVQNGLDGTKFFALAKDNEGAMWVGTDDGLTVFTCGFDGVSNCSGTRPIIKQDGLNAYLLQNERVTSIAIDKANRKWVGTANGLFLFSDLNYETLQHFTTENSPLFSNYINDIVIDHNSGTVYISTDKGILSYKGDAISGNVGHDNVVIYPNPIEPNYTGNIGIKGLPINATVKITDIAGNLVYETTSLGGQAVWNGKDYNDQPAASGVYLVFSSDPTAVQHQVHKLVIVR